MSSALPEQMFSPWYYTPNIRVATPYSPASVPVEFTVPHPTTGTEDEEPEDEHPGER